MKTIKMNSLNPNVVCEIALKSYKTKQEMSLFTLNSDIGNDTKAEKITEKRINKKNYNQNQKKKDILDELDNIELTCLHLKACLVTGIGFFIVKNIFK
jgi:hypothetical protein